MLFTTRISAVRAGPMNLSMETLYLLFFSIQDEQYHNKQHECVDLKLGGYYNYYNDFVYILPKRVVELVR